MSLTTIQLGVVLLLITLTYTSTKTHHFSTKSYNTDVNIEDYLLKPENDITNNLEDRQKRVMGFFRCYGWGPSCSGTGHRVRNRLASSGRTRTKATIAPSIDSSSTGRATGGGSASRKQTRYKFQPFFTVSSGGWGPGKRSSPMISTEARYNSLGFQTEPNTEQLIRHNWKQMGPNTMESSHQRTAAMAHDVQLLELKAIEDKLNNLLWQSHDMMINGRTSDLEDSSDNYPSDDHISRDPSLQDNHHDDDEINTVFNHIIRHHGDSQASQILTALMYGRKQ